MDILRRIESLASNSCMFLHPNRNFSICDFMVDNPQEGYFYVFFFCLTFSCSVFLTELQNYLVRA